ncbi:hypothetical protein B0J14DRAFT_556581 [Halenospora varia]|nr:hypothetical protein B0J14DRAFT_556581 [Halenospora varia]
MCRLYYVCFRWCHHTSAPHFRACPNEKRCQARERSPAKIKVHSVDGFCGECWTDPGHLEWRDRHSTRQWESDPDDTTLAEPTEEEKGTYKEILDRFRADMPYRLARGDTFSGLTNYKDYHFVKKIYQIMLHNYFWRREEITNYYSDREIWIINQLRGVIEEHVVDAKDSHEDEVTAQRREQLLFPEVSVSSLPPDERTCIICSEEFSDSGRGETERACKLASCGHVLGRSCIRVWIADKGNEAGCMTCRTRFPHIGMLENGLQNGFGSPWWVQLLRGDEPH